jgi:hypothetical protein
MLAWRVVIKDDDLQIPAILDDLKRDKPSSPVLSIAGL